MDNKVHTKEDLAKLYTKQLLRRLKCFRCFLDIENDTFNPIRLCDSDNEDIKLYLGTKQDAKREWQDMKEILATREHVPNKKEARIKRQEAAKGR